MTREQILASLFTLSCTARDAGENELAEAIEDIVDWPHSPRRETLAEAGRRGGSRRTEAKADAARRNGARGGRPRKLTP